MNRRQSAGFTVVELMITVVMVGILLAAAVPSYRGIIQNNRLTTQANTFVSSLQYARSEAIKRRGTVSLRPVDPANWALGWGIWADTRNLIDLNKDGDFADPGEQEAERLLRTIDAFEGEHTLAGPAGLLRIEYLPSGFARAASAGTFSLCKASGEKGRQVTLSATGQVNTKSDFVCP